MCLRSSDTGGETDAQNIDQPLLNTKCYTFFIKSATMLVALLSQLQFKIASQLL